jgi:hypothetical protein
MDAINGSVNASQSYALLNPLDLYQTAIYSELVRVVPRASALGWLKHLKGYMGTRKTDRHQYSFYQEGQYFRGKATIAAIAANGAMFDITLSAGDHSSVSGANKDSFVVKDQTVVFADGKTQGYVYDVNKTADGAHVVTVKKNTPSSDIASIALVGTSMVFFSNAQGEGGGKTSPRVEQYTKITNKMQVIREFFEVTDFEMQNKSWFNVNGKRYLHYHGVASTAERFELQTELAMLIQEESSGLTNLAGSAVQTMNGLFPQIRTGGQRIERIGSVDTAAFTEIIDALDANYGGNKYFVGSGQGLQNDLVDFLIAFGQQGTGNISFAPFGEGGATQALKLGFKSYNIHDYEFYFEKWQILSHEDSLGAEGLPFRDYGAFIPAGMTRDANPELAAGSPSHVPYIMSVTPPLDTMEANPNIIKGDYLMWEDGALAGHGPTNDVLKKGIHFARYQSLEMRCRNKFILWEKAAA